MEITEICKYELFFNIGLGNLFRYMMMPLMEKYFQWLMEFHKSKVWSILKHSKFKDLLYVILIRTIPIKRMISLIILVFKMVLDF